MPFPTRRRRSHRRGCLHHRCPRRSLRSCYHEYRQGGLWRYIGCKSRAANQVNSFHVPEFQQWISFLHKRIIFRIVEANFLSWRECAQGVTQLQMMHQGRSGIDTQTAITQRLEMVGTKWIAGVWTSFSLETTLTMLESPIPASSLTSRRCFGRRFAELFKGEDQKMAWSGIEGGGSEQTK